MDDANKRKKKRHNSNIGGINDSNEKNIFKKGIGKFKGMF